MTKDFAWKSLTGERYPVNKDSSRIISPWTHPQMHISKMLKKCHFLLLELMIGLYLVSLCALPLAQLPMKTLKEEIKSAYRMQMHRFADLAFAQIKEKLYRQEISWKQISSPSDDPTILMEDTITIAFEPLGSRKFNRKGTLHSVGKKAKSGEEWRLITFKVKFKPQEKKYKLFFNKKGSKVSSRTFIYQVLVSKSNPEEQSKTEKESPKPIKDVTPAHSKK
jgi:hypothetical protein